MSDRTWWQELWNTFCRWLAVRLPRSLVYYAALRLIDHAAPEYRQQTWLTIDEALSRWNWSDAQVAAHWRSKGGVDAGTAAPHADANAPHTEG